MQWFSAQDAPDLVARVAAMRLAEATPTRRVSTQSPKPVLIRFTGFSQHPGSRRGMGHTVPARRRSLLRSQRCVVETPSSAVFTLVLVQPWVLVPAERCTLGDSGIQFATLRQARHLRSYTCGFAGDYPHQR